MIQRPHTAMVLAAGLGTRMRPLTDDRPKALVEVGGRCLIDHMLDRLIAAGIERAVVNVHAFADQMEDHLRARSDVEILISDEREALMETGGGLKKAISMLGKDPILVANIDSLWIETGEPFLECLIQAWDPSVMDDLLLLMPLEHTLGFDGRGDFFRSHDGRLRHRGDDSSAPLAQIGLHMLHPDTIATWPDHPHSAFAHWMAFSQVGRLHGVVAEGLWMHVGDPAARDAAEVALGSGP